MNALLSLLLLVSCAEARENASGVAWGNASVVARDNASVEAMVTYAT